MNEITNLFAKSRIGNHLFLSVLLSTFVEILLYIFIISFSLSCLGTCTPYSISRSQDFYVLNVTTKSNFE